MPRLRAIMPRTSTLALTLPLTRGRLAADSSARLATGTPPRRSSTGTGRRTARRSRGRRSRHRLGRAGRRGRASLSLPPRRRRGNPRRVSTRRPGRRSGLRLPRRSTATTSASTTGRARRRRSPEGKVFTLGANGDLSAVELATGKKLWNRNLRDDYKADKGFFGVACSPLVDRQEGTGERRREGRGRGRVRRRRPARSCGSRPTTAASYSSPDRGRDRRQARGGVPHALRAARARPRDREGALRTSRCARGSTRACRPRHRSCGRTRSSSRSRTRPARRS